MRFLVDESTGKKTCQRLREAGHDAVFVGDVIPGGSDDAILANAESERRILVTDDKDFGELVFRLHRPTTGVVLLRTSTANSETRFKLLLNVVTNSKIDGNFITITEGRTRITKLPRRLPT